MTANSLGRVSVPVPGQPVPLATVLRPCCRIRVQFIAGSTGKMYFGTRAVNHRTFAGVIKELRPSLGAADDCFEVYTADNTDRLNLADYAIDAVVPGEGLIVAYWVG